MKRMLCIILSGLLLLSAAACTVTAAPVDPETPAGEPEEVQPAEPAVEQGGTDEKLPVEPIDDPIEGPIELTDPVEPIYVPEGEGAAVGGYADFSNLLSAALLSGTQNRNLSPISVYLALAMLTEGANGETQAELLKLLGCKDIAELRGVCGAMLESLLVQDENSTLEIHNSLWMAEAIDGMPVSFHESYLTSLHDVYQSEANTVQFGTLSAAKQIADWINEQTRGKIDVQPEAMRFDPSTLAVLINTIYLKDGWSEQFNEEATAPDTFYAPDGEMQVDYMNRHDGNSIVRFGDGWMAYRVYLRNVGYVTFVLPDEGIALSKLLGSPDAIDKLLHAGVERKYDVSLKIPKFKFKDKMELTEVLKALGLNVSLSNGADYSGMSDTPCAVDRILQESYIGVDEQGVEAAAYTMITNRATAFMPVELEKIDFHLTRPFFYAIESYDGAVLFIGTVTSPVAGE